MTIRFKIAAAALGLLLTTGLASAQTSTAPAAAQTQTDVGTATPTVKALAKTATIAHRQHRLHVSHRAVKHAKVAHRSIRARLAHKHSVKVRHIAKAQLVGTQKHAAATIQTKPTIVR